MKYGSVQPNSKSLKKELSSAHAHKIRTKHQFFAWPCKKVDKPAFASGYVKRNASGSNRQQCRGCICTYTAVSASTEAHLQVQRLYLQVQRLYLQVQICICKCHMPANKYRSVFAADADLCLYELLCCVCKCRGCICKCRGCICKYRGCICKYSSCYCTHGRCTTLLSRVHVLKIIWSTAPAHADNNNAFLFFQHSSSTQDVLL